MSHIPYTQQAYGLSTGTAQIPAFTFQERDPTANDIQYNLYSGWVNNQTKAIWYLESFSSTGGYVTAQWRAVGPIVVSEVNPTTSDYLYPLGQAWINSSNMTYWGLVSVVSNVATWEELSSGAATGILTLTGNSGGAVSYDTNRNINILGSSGQVVVTGDSGDNTLTISLAGGSTAIDSVQVDAFTAPGTDPVVPTSVGLITVTGGQIAAGTTANCIQTNSLAANTYAVQVQRSTAVSSSNAPSNGVSHFNSNNFNVDNNAFVSLASTINSFTPTIQGQTSGGATTYSIQSGSYVRMGTLVYAQLTIAWTAATGTGNLLVGGFPYNFGGGQSRAPTCSIYAVSITFPANATYLVGVGLDASKNLRIVGCGSTLAEEDLQMQNSGDIALSIIYETSDPF